MKQNLSKTLACIFVMQVIAAADLVAMPSFRLQQNSTAQANVVVTGRVTDEQGTALPGVTVRLKNTNVAAMTNNDGNYRIAVPKNGDILVFNMIGFSTVERAVSGPTLNIPNP